MRYVATLLWPLMTRDIENFGFELLMESCHLPKKSKQMKIYIYIYILFYFIFLTRAYSFSKRRDVFNPNDSFTSSTVMGILIPPTLTE